MRLNTSYEKEASLVRGIERFEDPATGNVLLELPISFSLLKEDRFRNLAERSGFTVESLYGDYTYGPYIPNESNSMIWFLRRGESF